MLIQHRQPTESRIVSSPEIAPEVPSTPIASVPSRIAAELGVLEWQVIAAIEMLDGGATVPFIARYRKEATGTLDDAQLRDLEERLTYLRELDDRRAAVVEAIRSQGKLTVELEKLLTAADSKARLEDIYLPFKTKRRTKAQIAREAGLQPLADSLLGDPSEYPERAAARYVNPDKGVADTAEALLGPDRSWSSGSAKMPTWWAGSANFSGPGADWSPRCAPARSRTAPSSATTST